MAQIALSAISRPSRTTVVKHLWCACPRECAHLFNMQILNPKAVGPTLNCAQEAWKHDQVQSRRFRPNRLWDFTETESKACLLKLACPDPKKCVVKPVTDQHWGHTFMNFSSQTSRARVHQHMSLGSQDLSSAANFWIPGSAQVWLNAQIPTKLKTSFARRFPQWCE